jgi:hypothetical protein
MQSRERNWSHLRTDAISRKKRRRVGDANIVEAAQQSRWRRRSANQGVAPAMSTDKLLSPPQRRHMDDSMSSLPWFAFWWSAAPRWRYAAPHPTPSAMCSGSGKLNGACTPSNRCVRASEQAGHAAIVPSLKGWAWSHVVEVRAAPTSHPGRLWFVGEEAIRWFNAIESMEVPMRLPVSLHVYTNKSIFNNSERKVLNFSL